MLRPGLVPGPVPKEEYCTFAADTVVPWLWYSLAVLCFVVVL